MAQGCVTLLGGTGFIGIELAMRLAERYAEVRVVTRRGRGLRELGVLTNLRTVRADVHDADALHAALAGSDVVINLVGVLNETGSKSKGSFAVAHDGLTGKTLAACEALGIPRYLHMSALNADGIDGSSEYLKSKGRAEKRVRAAPAGIAWTIFRPSIVFGARDAFFNRFAGLLRLAPFFPLAGADSRMAPVWVGDVCRAMIDAIDDPAMHGVTVSLCGPEVFTLKELVEYTGRVSGHPRKVFGIPEWAARLQATILERVPGKPLSHDNLDSLKTDSVCPDGCAPQPTSVDSIVPRYLGEEDWLGRLQESRESARR